MGYVQTWDGMEEIVPAITGRVVAVTGRQGDKVAKGEIVAFIVDTKTRELIWVDAPFTAGKGHVAACDLRVVAQVQDAIKTRMNLYDFFLLHSGHVSFVDDPKEADLFIGEEDEANLKPYFVQDIIADWL